MHVRNKDLCVLARLRERLCEKSPALFTRDFAVKPVNQYLCPHPLKQKIKNILSSPSRLAIITILLFIIAVQNNQNKWRGTVIEWDAVSYYSWLPATFIEKDLKLSFINDNNAAAYAHQSKYYALRLPNGKYMIKGSMGMAVMYAPFFFLAHAIAPHTEYAADGFSLPYQFAVLFSGLLYFITGLFYLRKTLLLFYSEKITCITLIALYFGTNLLCYTTLQAVMSHQYIFALFSVFTWFSIKWYNSPKLKYSIILGLTFGLIILVRPVNALFFLFFLLYGIQSIADLKTRIVFLFRKSLHLLLIGLLSFLVFLPQLLYFHYITGNYFFNSYIGEWFYFANPHLAECLVGFRKGWLIYTPMMIFALCGLYFLRKTARPFFIVSLFLVCLYIYVLSSWWCWWYGGSFGWRAMIDLYPLLTLPLAAFFSAVLYQKKIRSKITGVFIGLFIVLNLFQTIQFHYNVIHYDSMTKAAYFDSFGKLSRFDCDRTLLKSPDYNKALKGEE
jgi:hypothetical protein